MVRRRSCYARRGSAHLAGLGVNRLGISAADSTRSSHARVVGSAATAGKRCYSTWHSWGIRMPTLRFCSISPTSSPVVVVGGQAGGRQVPFAATSPEHVCAGPTPTTWGGLGNTCGTRGSRLAAEVGRGGVVGQDDQPARLARHGSAEGLFGPQRISSVGARAARSEQPSSWHRRRRASSDARRKPLRSPAC